MKIVNHGCKGSKPKTYMADGGRVPRQSNNIEDRRTSTRWDARAQKALDEQTAMPNPNDLPNVQPATDTARARMGAMTAPAGTKGKTPSNNGIDDHFTRSRQFKSDDPATNYQQQMHAAGTTTPPNSSYTEQEDDDAIRDVQGNTPRRR